MNSAMRDARTERKKDTQRVTLVGAVLNLVLSVIKVIGGMLANSQSLIADGIHSLSDLASDGIVWYAAHHSSQAPDDDHPYGHGRFETLATLALGVLLLLVAVGIIWDAAGRLFEPESLQTPGMLAVWAALFSILAKEWLYHFTMGVAKRHKSEMLRANAWHHRSDSISSVVVLIGVAGTMAGLPYLDAIAAVLVGVMIGHIAWELGAPALNELTDAGLEEERLGKIRDIINSVSGVESIHMLRTRRTGASASMDVHVLVASWISVSEGHMIGQEVTDRLLKGLDELNDVTVHIDPEDDEIGVPCRGLPLRREAQEQLDELLENVEGYAGYRRLLLHYLDGAIDVDIQYPLDSFVDAETTARLREDIRNRIADRSEFRRISLSYH